MNFSSYNLNKELVRNTREPIEEIDNSEKNEIYHSLNTYFMNQRITDKNKYTGIFKGKNRLLKLFRTIKKQIKLLK